MIALPLHRTVQRGTLTLFHCYTGTSYTFGACTSNAVRDQPRPNARKKLLFRPWKENGLPRQPGTDRNDWMYKRGGSREIRALAVLPTSIIELRVETGLQGRGRKQKTWEDLAILHESEIPILAGCRGESISKILLHSLRLLVLALLGKLTKRSEKWRERQHRYWHPQQVKTFLWASDTSYA